MTGYALHTINYKTYVHRPIEDVFDAISTAEGWNNWFTTSCRLEPWPGGLFAPEWIAYGPDLINSREAGRVLEVAPPDRLVLRWTPCGPEAPTTVEFTLAEQFGGTVVHVKDSGYLVDTLPQQRTFVECACGWGEALTLLKFFLEYGVRYRHPQTE